MGIVDTSFQSDGTGKYVMPIRHLSIHFAPLAVSYGLFHGEIKDNWISSRLNPKVHSNYFLGNSTWVISGKRATKWPLCGLFKSSWHMLPCKVHVTQL